MWSFWAEWIKTLLCIFSEPHNQEANPEAQTFFVLCESVVILTELNVFCLWSDIQFHYARHPDGQ